MFFLRRVFVISILSIVTLSLGVAYGDDSCAPAHSNGTDVAISLADDQTPSSDLVCDAKCMAQLQKSQAPAILSPDEAWTDKMLGVDLSMLEPDPSTDVFKGYSTSTDASQDEALALQNLEQVEYKSDICSSSGLYRFNIQTQGSPNHPSQTMTLMLSRNLHSFLLRKELLRKLGYKIPPFKYLPHIKVHFADETVNTAAGKMRLMDAVLNRWLPLATDGNSKDWCGMAKSALDPLLAKNKDYQCNPLPDAELSGDSNTIELQDVIVTQATPLYYDLALGPPIERIPGTTNLRPETMRIVRALGVVYGFLNIPESVNQFDWTAAHEQNGSITLHVPDQANFATTLDDALWITRRLAQLTRQDFEQIVASSDYPSSVGKVIVEKLIGRRDALIAMFGLKNPAIPFDTQLNALPDVQSGKLITQKFPGYASHFANDDQQSPLKDIKWYIVSEAEANAMQALMTRVNSYLPSASESYAFSQHLQNNYNQAMQQYLQTGTVQQIPAFKPWVGPVANGSVQISREVVLGQYMGTNNLVQLADTFGFTANAGFVVGFDSIPSFMSLSGMVQGTLNISLTHLKPLQQLKDAVNEPLKNEIVSWVFQDAANAFKKIADSQRANANLQDPNTVKAINQELATDVDQLKQYLGPGESLILTESISGDEQLAAGFQPSTWSSSANLLPSVGPRVDFNQIVLSRLHFYRGDGKNSNMILVFNDRGNLIGPTLTIEASLGSSVSFPVFSFTAKGVTGTAKAKVFQFNLLPDVQANGAIYAVAGGIASALRNGNTDFLETELKLKPTLVSVDFHDKSSTTQLFHWVWRTLKSNGDLGVQLNDGTSANYITLTDGGQNGVSYQQLGTQVASYLVQRLANNAQYSIDTQTNPNPGQSFFGHSQTRDASFQGQVNSNALSNPYVRVQYRWQGWDLTAEDARKLVDSLTSRYGVKFYDTGFLGNATDIKMYELMLVVNVYDAGIRQVLSMSEADEKAFEKKYKDRNQCDADPLDFESRSRRNLTESLHCVNLADFHSALARARKGEKNPDDLAKDMLQAISNLEQFADFDDFVTLLGGVNNPDQKPRIYIGSQITGFREGTEEFSDPIHATRAFGKADGIYPNGVVDWVQNNLLGIEDGEFNMKWLRDVL